MAVSLGVRGFFNVRVYENDNYCCRSRRKEVEKGSYIAFEEGWKEGQCVCVGLAA